MALTNFNVLALRRFTHILALSISAAAFYLLTSLAFYKPQDSRGHDSPALCGDILWIR